MKKNMLAIIILAIGLANLAMTAVMLFVIIPSVNNTSDLVGKVAKAIDLDIEQEEEKKLSIYDTETYAFTEASLTINLKKDAGSDKDSYTVITGISLLMDKTKEDFSSANGKITSNEIIVSDIITTVYEGYTKEEAQNNKEQVKKEILKKISEEFETDIVADIAFASIVYQ